MSDQPTGVELNRWQVMKVLRGEGYSFPAMIPVLTGLGMVDCQDDHRTRIRRDNGETVCVTCENTLLQAWRRGLVRLAEHMPDVNEAKGAWIEDHQFIVDVCVKRHVQNVKITTTRISTHVETVEGKDIPVTTTVTTIREHTQTNQSLLRLLADVRDKMARVAGMNVDRPVTGEKAPDVELNVFELPDDGAAGPPN